MPLPAAPQPDYAFDRERLKRAVHYLVWICEDPASFGAPVLQRILWYSDRNTLLNTGHPLFGASFWKRPQGPVAKAVDLALSELAHEGAIAVRARSNTIDAKQFFALRPPETGRLEAEQVSILEATARAIVFQPHTQIFRRPAHDAIFRAAKIGELLPWFTAYGGAAAEITEADLEWAAREANSTLREPDWGELEELRQVNRRIEDACSGLVWFLSRELSAGVPVPDAGGSVFFYKQQAVDGLDIPEIAVIFRVDLGELVLGRFRFSFPDLDQQEDLTSVESE